MQITPLSLSRSAPVLGRSTVDMSSRLDKSIARRRLDVAAPEDGRAPVQPHHFRFTHHASRITL
jgi:hypothetical protein